MTADHVFAKSLFATRKRGGLPIVAACEACNNAKSKLEHYAATVLPMGSGDPAALEVWDERGIERVKKNRIVRDHLKNASTVWVTHSKVLMPRMGIPFEPDQITGLFEFIAKGLVNHHWNAVVPADYFVGAKFAKAGDERPFMDRLVGHAADEVRGVAGDDAVLYQGWRFLDDPWSSFWRARIYGGLTLGQGGRSGDSAPFDINMLVMPRSVDET